MPRRRGDRCDVRRVSRESTRCSSPPLYRLRPIRIERVEDDAGCDPGGEQREVVEGPCEGESGTTTRRVGDARSVHRAPGAPSWEAPSRAGCPPLPNLPVMLLAPRRCQVDPIGTRVVHEHDAAGVVTSRRARTAVGPGRRPVRYCRTRASSGGVRFADSRSGGIRTAGG